MRMIKRLYTIPLLLAAALVFTGCALNDGNAGGIAGMYVWLDANEGLEYYSGTSFVQTWENLADPEHGFYSLSSPSTIMCQYTTIGYLYNSHQYLYFNGSGMQAPIVVDDSTFSIVIAGNISDSNYLVTVPTKAYGDIYITGTTGNFTVTAMGYPSSTTPFTSNGDVYFFIFRRYSTSNYLSMYAFDLYSMSSTTYDFTINNGYYPSTYMSLGNASCYIGDLMIFDHALSSHEISDLSSYFRKKYKF